MARLIETAGKNVVKFGTFDVAKAPLLADSLELAKADPKLVLRTFATYDLLIKDLFTLTDDELKIIARANEKIHKPLGAHEFMKNMSQYKDEILSVAKHGGDLMNEKNAEGMAELATKMKNAWDLKQSDPNWKPTDGDPRSDNIIWGFVNDAADPRTDIDFAVGHGIERIVTQPLRAKGVKYVESKDWIITALEDLVAIRGLKGHYPETKVFDLWTTRRPNGLGWISADRLNAYREFLSPHK